MSLPQVFLPEVSFGFLDDWAARHGFASLDEFRGRLSAANVADEVFQRVQYMRYFPHGVR